MPRHSAMRAKGVLSVLACLMVGAYLAKRMGGQADVGSPADKPAAATMPSAASPTLSAKVATGEAPSAFPVVTAGDLVQTSPGLDDWLLELTDGEFSEAYNKLVAPSTTAGDRAAIMADLVSRPDPLRLPFLVNLISLDDHPFREDALAILESKVGDDYGTNLIGWADAASELLAESLPAGVERP